MRVSIAWSPRAGVADEMSLEVPAGSTVLDALRAGGLLDRADGVDLGVQAVGVWGRACALTTSLKDADRVEVYRALAMDPMEARRLRAGRR